MLVHNEDSSFIQMQETFGKGFKVQQSELSSTFHKLILLCHVLTSSILDSLYLKY